MNSTTILLHRIEWWVENDVVSELDEYEQERIEQMITEGFREGELNISFMVGDKEESARGWWKIS
jgi:ABC-type iron transport system FetAB ATPase subunit